MWKLYPLFRRPDCKLGNEISKNFILFITIMLYMLILSTKMTKTACLKNSIFQNYSGQSFFFLSYFFPLWNAIFIIVIRSNDLYLLAFSFKSVVYFDELPAKFVRAARLIASLYAKCNINLICMNSYFGSDKAFDCRLHGFHYLQINQKSLLPK